MNKKLLIDKFGSHDAKVGVVGLGYVGLPLVIEFIRAGFEVLGLDIDQVKVDKLFRSETYIKHIPGEKLEEINSTGRFDATTDFSRAKECDAILICVPTPLSHHREPDMSYIVSTAKTLGPHVRENQLYCLESTTYPGTTEEVLVPELEKCSSLKAGVDFFVAYSPEREDPNNKNFSTSTIPKVVGGYTPESLEVATTLYNQIICRTVPVSSAATAEATKLMENIFRAVNIALVNELKIVFEKMDIDIWEVVEAAKTKPFGYMPFYPGPGLGGHCIPIDPFYLTWKAREYHIPTRFIELAGEINTDMPYYVLRRALEIMNDHGKALKGSKVLVIGLAYKKNVDDIRESPSFLLWKLFEEKGAIVSYHDPYCEEVHMNREYPQYSGVRSVDLDNLQEYDLVLVSTAHDCIDFNKVKDESKLVIDTRNTVPAAPNVFRA